MSPYAVRTTDLRVTRSGQQVLDGVSVGVRTGVVTGLLGPSGSGKTTLIRTIAGTQLFSGGSVEVLGRPAGDPQLRHEIGYAAQSAAVYADLTVNENVRYFARVLRAPASDTDRVIEAVDLGRYRHRLVSRLSGGERSRVNLAIALLGKPRLLLLDEPTVGLDPVLREELWQLFARLAADGITLLASSHVIDEAARCDRLLLMREGRILLDGTPAELRERTGRQDLGEAFLELVRAEIAA